MKDFVIPLGVEAWKMFGVRKMPPEQRMHFKIIEDAIDMFLCGVYNDRMYYFDEEEHIEAREFIFETEGDFSFSYHWQLAFPNLEVGAREVRRALLRIFEKRHDEWRRNAKDNNNGRRKRNSALGNNDKHTGDHLRCPAGKRIQSILFGPGP